MECSDYSIAYRVMPFFILKYRGIFLIKTDNSINVLFYTKFTLNYYQITKLLQHKCPIQIMMLQFCFHK